jgi:hypothetical protein
MKIFDFVMEARNETAMRSTAEMSHHFVVTLGDIYRQIKLTRQYLSYSQEELETVREN